MSQESHKIGCRGDAEVRAKRKEVAKAVEKAPEGVEHVGEAVEKRLSFVSTTTPPVDESPKGFDIDKDITEEVTPSQEQADVPVIVDLAVPELPTSVQFEETPAEVPSPVGDAPTPRI